MFITISRFPNFRCYERCYDHRSIHRTVSLKKISMSGASLIWCGCRPKTRCLNPWFLPNVNLAQSSEVTQLKNVFKKNIHYIRVWIFDPFEWMGRLRVEVSSTAKVNPDVSCRWKPSYVTLNVSKAIGSTVPNFNMFIGGINHQNLGGLLLLY